MKISLHHFTIWDVSAEELIDIAAQLRCDHICTFVKTPRELPLPLPIVESVRRAQTLRDRATKAGVSVYNTDTFVIGETEPAAHEESLEISSALGATTINSIYRSCERGLAARKLAAFARMAAKYNIAVLYEWSRLSKVRTLSDSIDFLRMVNEPNVQLNVDVLHLIRNGEHPADLGKADPGIIQYAQLSDGPAVLSEAEHVQEAMGERNFPGMGEFPLIEFVQKLPTTAVVAVESPVNRMRGVLSPTERATRAVDGTRRILAAAGR